MPNEKSVFQGWNLSLWVSETVKNAFANAFAFFFLLHSTGERGIIGFDIFRQE